MDQHGNNEKISERGGHRIFWEQKERTFDWVQERLMEGFGAKLLKGE